jgi:fructose-specific phosphotransferase system IIC component
MTKRPNLIVPAVILGGLLIALAILYFASTADSLPSFIPGHESGSSDHHIKHGIAALLLGIGAFAFAWFQTEGPADG